MAPTMESCLAGLASRGFKPNCIYDIGAADGAWTQLSRHYWPAARSVLFEPLIERATDLNRVASELTNVSWYNCGIGREVAELQLSISSDLYESSFAYGGASSRSVPVRTLDLLLIEEKLPSADFLKIDVQGFELEVLAGATQFIKAVQVVIMETYFHRFAPQMSLVHEAVDEMHRKGFRVYEILDQMPRPYDQAIGQCDICFVREGHDLLKCNSWA